MIGYLQPKIEVSGVANDSLGITPPASSDIVLMTTAPAGPSELSNPVVDPSVGTVYEPSSRAGEPFVTILSGGADTDEITIAFSGRADPIPLALCYTEETVRPSQRGARRDLRGLAGVTASFRRWCVGWLNGVGWKVQRECVSQVACLLSPDLLQSGNGKVPLRDARRGHRGPSQREKTD